MKYDLSNPLHRGQFAARAKALLGRGARVVELTDRSSRTVSQNSYLHVLIRVMAMETGVSERYAKDVYFKRMANPDIFVRTEADPLTGGSVETLRGSSELSSEEMAHAISTFRIWAAEQGCYLPEAHPTDDGGVAFASPEDEEGFRQAEVEVERGPR